MFNYCVHITAPSPEKLQDVIKHPLFSAEALRKFYSISQEISVDFRNKEEINEGSNSIVLELDFFLLPPLLFLKQFIDLEPSLTIEIRGWHYNKYYEIVLEHWLLSKEGTYFLFDDEDLRDEINACIEEDGYQDRGNETPNNDYWIIDLCFKVMDNNGGRSWRRLRDIGTYDYNSPIEYGDVLSFPLDLIPEKYHQEYMRDPSSFRDKARNIVRIDEERIMKEWQLRKEESKRSQWDKAEVNDDEKQIVIVDDEDDDDLPF